MGNVQVLSDSLDDALEAVGALTANSTAKCAGFTQLPGAREVMVSAKRLQRYVKKGRVKHEGPQALTINGVASYDLVRDLGKAWLESTEDHADEVGYALGELLKPFKDSPQLKNAEL